MDWVWYVVALVVAFIVVSAVVGIVILKRNLNGAWQQLSDAFGGSREPRAMQIAPEGAADRLDYDNAQFLGYFELTNEFLIFYWYKIRGGAVIEIPVEWIQNSSRIEGHHEPAATLVIETPDGEKFTIAASVPQQLCNRLTRLGSNAKAEAP